MASSDEVVPAAAPEALEAAGAEDLDQDKRENKPGGPSLPRQRVSTHQHLGQVLDWRGNYGWIMPMEQIRHPKASMRQGRVFISRTDLANAKYLMPGTFVQFQVYEDELGLGAEKCYVWKGPPNFMFFKGKGKGKGKKGEKESKGEGGKPGEGRKDGKPSEAPAGKGPSSAPKGGPEGAPGGKGGDRGPGGPKGDRPKGGNKGGKGFRPQMGGNPKGAGRGPGGYGGRGDGGKGRGKPQMGGGMGGGDRQIPSAGGPGAQAQANRPQQMPTANPQQQQVPQPQLQPQLGMGSGGFGLMPGMPNLMEFPGAGTLGMSVPQGLQGLPNLQGLQGLQGLQNLPNLQSLSLAGNPAWAAFVQQPQVPGRNMGAMPGAATGPSGGPPNPNFGGMLPGYMELGDNLRGLQGGQQGSYKGGLAGQGGFMG